ncbi:MAG: hypothetical protein M1840_005129 [Geoglossum simile]|nr:MAG: hypothetical protein M1840_005129 [Geoglossum simile]
MSTQPQPNGTSSPSEPTTSGVTTPPTDGKTPPPEPSKPQKSPKKATRPNATPLPPKIKLVLSTLQQIDRLATTLTESTSELRAIDDTNNEYNRVQRELAVKDDALKEKEMRVEELEKSKKELVDDFQHRYYEWKTENTKLGTAVAALSKELKITTLQAEDASKKEKDLIDAKTSQDAEVEHLNTLLKSRGDEVAALTRHLTLESTAARYAEAQVATMEQRLENWEDMANTLANPNFQQFSTNMANLSKSCDTFVRKYFLGDLEVLTDSKPWDDYTTALHIPLRLPITNTPQAQRARMAAASNVLATRICTNIFKAFYIPESPAASDQIGQLLSQFYSHDTEKLKMYRAILLFAWPGKVQEHAMEKALLMTYGEILQLLKPFVTGDITTFDTELDAILTNAMSLWLPIQRSKAFVVASTSDIPGWSWVKDDEYDKETIPPEPSPGDTRQGPFLLSLFPRAYAPKTPEGTVVLHPGKALQSDQKVVLASKKEYKRLLQERVLLHGIAPGLQQRGYGRFAKLMSPPSSPSNPNFTERSRARGRVSSVDLGRTTEWTTLATPLPSEVRSEL